jgi:predicted ferric reductase
VGGLWITSPPDVIDALLFSSPTPFSNWGVIAMWTVLVAGALAASRRRLNISPRMWRRIHTILAPTIVVCTVMHALLIDGTMETTTKALLSALAVLATLKVLFDLKVWRIWRRT